MEPLPLRDLHLPEPIGWWPPAVGWWVVAGLILIGAAGLLLWLRQRRRPAPLKRALRELESIEAEADPAEKLRRLSILLRKVALSLYPRREVAGLVGEDWLRWLDQTLGEPKFGRGVGRLLAEAPYRPVPAAEWNELLKLSRDWLRSLSRAEKRRRAHPTP